MRGPWCRLEPGEENEALLHQHFILVPGNAPENAFPEPEPEGIAAQDSCTAIPCTRINVPKCSRYLGWWQSRKPVSKVIPAFCWVFLFPSGLVFCCLGEPNCLDLG